MTGNATVVDDGHTAPVTVNWVSCHGNDVVVVVGGRWVVVVAHAASTSSKQTGAKKRNIHISGARPTATRPSSAVVVGRGRQAWPSMDSRGG